MDAYQHPNRFMRPPPPPPLTGDPRHQHFQYHHHQQPQPGQPTPWFSNQFQYHPSQSPPQWAPPPPHSAPLNPPPPNSYPPPPYPYPAHHLPHNDQFPPPQMVPPHPPQHHPQIPQSYPQINQEWGNPNWAHHQGWDHPAQKNDEDWAARAKAWADAKVAMEMQHPQSQFMPAGRPEEQSPYHDHYPQANDSHYPDIQQTSLPGSSYQQFPPPAAPPHRPPLDHVQDIASISSGPSSYVPDGHLLYSVRDGTLAGDSNAVYPHQDTTNPSVHLQEVPSSYSSVTVKEEAADQNQHAYTLLPLPSSSSREGQQHMQPTLPATARSVPIEHPFAYGSQSADLTTDLSDQPLDFAPRFTRDHEPHMQSSYVHHDVVGPLRGVDPTAAVPSIHTWTPPVTPGGVYPPIAPVLPSGPQHDPSIAVRSPVSGHPAAPFGRFHGPSFQAAIPSAGAPFGLGAGTAVHPPTAFLDAYGVSGVPERPKKASVPNWLREEIIKKKHVITSSSHELPKEETQSIEDDGVDKSIGKGDQADNKSGDSSRSIEEEDDDDEDYVEAARTAAINKEIKRVLTEVLLKVTDELFDEIATKVLSEDDLTVEVAHNTVASNHKVAPSSPADRTPKASAKVLIPVKAKETETESVSGKSSSSSPGDVLGLANYASDDDNEEIQSSSAINQQSNAKKLSKDKNDAVENGSSQGDHEEHIGGLPNMGGDPSRASPVDLKNNHNAVSGEFNDNRVARELGHGNVEHRRSLQAGSADRDNEIYVDGRKMLDDTNASLLKDIVKEKVTMKSELPGKNVNLKKYAMGDSQGKETRMNSDKNDHHESKRSFVKDFVKEVESGKIKADEKGDENRRRHEERHLRKEKADDRNGSKERTKEQCVKSGEKAKEYESRKRSTHSDLKEVRKEAERLRKVSADEDLNRKKERTNEEDDRSKHRLASDSSRHKRIRSSSISSRGRNGKDNSVNNGHDSSDETSHDSKRKPHSRKRNLSPSPVRSRRRQVSRSPHSKHSQRRHSPYYSLEATRGRRSRSKSPVRRQR